jgi:phage-related protein
MAEQNAATRETPKPVEWIGSSRKVLRDCPAEVKAEFGFAIFEAQLGAKHVAAKPMYGFGGAGVLEVVADDRSGTFRAIYTVKFAMAIYVLHVFQKKSKRGIKTPREDLEIIRKRLKDAADHYKEKYER